MKLVTFFSIGVLGCSLAFACSSSSDNGGAADSGADAPTFTCAGIEDPAGKSCGVGDQCQVDIASQCVNGVQAGDTSASCFCASGTWQCSYVQSKVTTPCGDSGTPTSNDAGTTLNDAGNQNANDAGNSSDSSAD